MLRPGGAVVMARHGPKHCIELREALAKLRAKDERRGGRQLPPQPPERVLTPKQFAAGLGENYVRIHRQEELSVDQATNLLTITPALRDAVAKGGEGSLEAATTILDRLLVARDGRAGTNGRARDGTSTPTPQLRCTMDMMISTHRVWLGTGGEPV